VASYAGRQGEVRNSDSVLFVGESSSGVNDAARIAGFTATQIDTLYALFNERDNQEKLSAKKLFSPSLEWVLDTGASYHVIPMLIFLVIYLIFLIQ